VTGYRRRSTINETTTTILITLVVYKFILIGIGIWTSRRVKDEADFLVGGRGLGAVVAGMSYAASTSSAWALLGFSGFVFTVGLSALWMLPGIWGGYVIMWVLFGPRIREESSRKAFITPTEFLTANMDAHAAKQIAALAALLIAFCFMFYIAAQFAAAAQAFVTNFQMNLGSSIVISASIILIYCLLGGFWAASITDTLQGFVMIAVAMLVPTLAVIEAGGPGQIIDTLWQTNSKLTMWSGGYSGFLLLGLVFGLSGVGIGTFGQPHLLSRLMAVKGDRERRNGFVIALTWAVIVYVGMAWLALAARSLALTPDATEQIFYILAEQLLPPILAGIVVAAILSAIMSTVDSLLLAASAAVAHDLNLAERFQMRENLVSRIVMTGIVVLAVVLAVVLPDTIFNRVLFAWSALGAAFGPIVAVRVLNLEPPAIARIWSIVVGFSLTVFFYSYGTLHMEFVDGAINRFFTKLANLPGDPFERLIPFIMAFLIVYFWPQTKTMRRD
jgi:sodium/proline symporter